MTELANLRIIEDTVNVLKHLEQTPHTPEHFQIEGVYARLVHIPAAHFVSGYIHNKESIGILAYGTMRITNGETTRLISAPYIAVEKPGIMRFAYTETRCTFITISRTDGQTIEDIEEELVSKDIAEYERRRIGVAK